MMMKIAFSWNYDETKPKKWSTPGGLSDAFANKGYSVVNYGFDPNNTDMSRLILDADEYDLIMICKAGPSDSFDSEVKRLRENTKTKIFMEFGDDIPGSVFFDKRKPYVDHIFTPDKRQNKKYNSEGLKSSWMPSWCDTSIFRKIDNPDRKNICVTTCIGQRPLLSEFKNIFGDKFLHERVDGSENTSFYNSGTFTYQFARFNELTRRIFEAGGCGNAIITNRIDPDTGIYELFPEDECIAYFSSGEEAMEKMNRLYNDDDYRSKLSDNLYETIQDNHLVEHRVDQIIEVYND